MGNNLTIQSSAISMPSSESGTTTCPQLIHNPMDKQKSPSEVGGHIFLMVMPKKGVVMFGKRGKLSPRYIRPFEILERVGTVVYWLALPLSLSGVNEVFHVSMLLKYTPDLTHVVDWGELVIDVDGTFEDEHVRLLDS